MHQRTILFTAALGAASTLVALAGTASGTTAAPDRVLDRNLNGTAAVKALGDDLDTVARRYDKSPAAMAELLRSDTSLWVDRTGMVHVKEPLPAQPAKAAGSPEAGPFPNADTFLLHSRVGAERTVFLDFDGGPVSGTSWNDNYGVSTASQPAFDLDGNPAAWNQAEHDTIQSVFQRVAEDFRPFDVDVTTQDPGAAALARTSAADTEFGTRVLISPSVSAHTAICPSGCGGVAYVGIYNLVGNTYYHPAWVFPQMLSNNAKYIAEATSHEAGHNLGLWHDGTSTVGYYTGHHNWAPIMGVGYYEPLVQWSSGEYNDASETQDDIAVMQSYGLPLRVDDHGNGFGTPTVMGTTRRAAGFIERRTDIDAFSFRRTCRGATTIKVTPFDNSPNLDARVRLFNSGHAALGTGNPASGQASYDVATGLDGSITRNLGTGTYFIFVDGVGTLTPGTGYSDYGSLGRFGLQISKCP